MPEPRPLRRRSGLLQERSRQTRQRLVRAALELWTVRGFETGIEDTTVEEISQAAGVTKGTFYFHFARKEEILLEMGWDTAAFSGTAGLLRGWNAHHWRSSSVILPGARAVVTAPGQGAPILTHSVRAAICSG